MGQNLMPYAGSSNQNILGVNNSQDPLLTAVTAAAGKTGGTKSQKTMQRLAKFLSGDSDDEEGSSGSPSKKSKMSEQVRKLEETVAQNSKDISGLQDGQKVLAKGQEKMCGALD